MLAVFGIFHAGISLYISLYISLSHMNLPATFLATVEITELAEHAKC